MGPIFLCLLLLAAEAYGDDYEAKDCSRVTDRIDKLECLVSRQGDKLILQESLLHQQDAKLSNQESLLGRQAAELSHLKALLRHQNSKLSRQESLLFRQDKILQRLLAEKRQGQDGSQQTEAELQFFPENSTDDITSSVSGSLDKNEKATSASHDVIARADDTGPLETVVNHISQQVTVMSADIEALKNSNTQQDQSIQNAHSSTFVHWGNSECDSSSHLVYSGILGGSWEDNSGAPPNYLCLTKSPVLVSSIHTSFPWLAYLYGAEYEMANSEQYQKDAVCAVCRSTFPTTIMIPGTNVCTPGWHLHYSGYLMAGHQNAAAGSEFICVNSRLESAPHSEANQNGASLFYTVTKCGSLPCSPYVNDKVVTCAVCGK